MKLNQQCSQMGHFCPTQSTFLLLSPVGGYLVFDKMILYRRFDDYSVLGPCTGVGPPLAQCTSSQENAAKCRLSYYSVLHPFYEMVDNRIRITWPLMTTHTRNSGRW